MRKNLMRLLAFMWFAIAVGTLHAQVAQAPLISAAAVVPPNLVYTLDDSGSMFIECQTDGPCFFRNEGRFVGVVPYGTGPNGSTSQKTAVVTYAVNNLYNRQLRSPQVNTLYYNPAFRYLPWINSNGVRSPTFLITAAPINPRVPGVTVNLAMTQSVTISGPGLQGWCTSTSTSTTACTTGSGGAIPATETVYVPQYFTLTGTNTAVLGSYTQTLITGVGSTYPKGPNRIDCLGAVCTLAEEQQNFSNWFTYHRNRLYSVIASSAEAFQNLPATYRLGYGRINQNSGINIDGVSSQTLVRGLRPFTGVGRDEFYSWLLNITNSGSTPMRRAMGDVGEYFRRADNAGPWANTPGNSADSTPHLACRRSYNIFATDGAYTSNGAADEASNSAARANVDGTAGPVITGPNGQTYPNALAFPYRDSFSNTLADVSAYYWKNDLRPDLSNQVPITTDNPAFWQSMVNYTVAFGAQGFLRNPADLPGLTSGTLTWANPLVGFQPDSPSKLDDLWHAAINSRGKAFIANNPAAFAESLLAIVNEIDNREGSEAGVAVSGRQLNSTTRKYVPEYRTGVWAGRLAAVPLGADAQGDTPVWQAADLIPAPADRRIYTYSDSTPHGISFTWANLVAQSLTSSLSVSAAQGTGLVAYLRGDRTGEGTTYRTRSGVLGDIVNSSPQFVRNLIDLQYDFLPNGTPGRDNYRQFLNRKSRRIGQIFVGANDGMMHAFSDADGVESFAFIPRAVLGNLRFLSISPYNHRYYVDGPALETDVYDAAVPDWRNLVVGGGGAGAKNLFAINVPTPSAATAASTATAALYPPGPSDVLWEISSADAAYSELGFVLHTPEGGQMRNGGWVVITGNGYESASRKAQLYIINALTGVRIGVIDTGVGSMSTPNGLGGVRVVRDAQQRIVSAYAGDLLGNIWKFDLSGNTVASWNVAFGGIPLYRARNRQNQPESVTSAPTFVPHPLGGVLVLTGGGKLFENSDTSTIDERTLYGLWDRVRIGDNSSTPTGIITGTVSLVLQTITNTITVVTGGETSTFFTLTSNPVDYGTARGWRMPLTIQPGQRLVFDPQVSSGRAFFETLVPGVAAASCIPSNSGVGYNFVIDPLTGAAGLGGATFDTNGDGVINGADNPQAVGYKSKADGSDSIVLAGRPPPPATLCTVAPCACGTPPCINNARPDQVICTVAPCSCGAPPCIVCTNPAGCSDCTNPGGCTRPCGYTVASDGSRAFACDPSTNRRNWRQLFTPPF